MAGLGSASRNASIRSMFGADKGSLALGTLYFALLNGSPVSGGVEPTSAGGYARVARLNDAALWGTYTASDLAVTNKGASGAIQWPAATGLWSQTTLTHWAIYDNAAGGNLWYWGPLSENLVMTGAGDVVQFPPSTLTIAQGA